MPEGAAADPGGALSALAASYGSQLIGVLQGAGGNAEVDAELAAVMEGQQVAAKAKADKDAVNAMTDGQKVEQFGKKDGGGGGGGGGAGGGGGGGGGGEAKADAPPPGTPDPGAASGFHARRAGELQGLAANHASVAAALGQAAAVPGLAPELVAFLGQGAAQSQAQQAALTGLAGTYAMVGAQLAGSEFIGAALPTKGVQTGYETRIGAIQGVVTTLDSMTGEYDAALAAEQAKIGECDAKIAELQAQLAEAKASAKQAEAGGNVGGAGGDAKAAPAPDPDSAPRTGPKNTPPTEAKGAKGGKSDAAAKKSSSTSGITGGSPAITGGSAGGAETKKDAGEGGGAGGGGAEPAMKAEPSGPAGGDAGAAAAAAMQAEIDAQVAKKKTIEDEIAANTTLISTMKAYREQMNTLLAAYSAGSTPPAAAGGG